MMVAQMKAVIPLTTKRLNQWHEIRRCTQRNQAASFRCSGFLKKCAKRVAAIMEKRIAKMIQNSFLVTKVPTPCHTPEEDLVPWPKPGGTDGDISRNMPPKKPIAMLTRICTRK